MFSTNTKTKILNTLKTRTAHFGSPINSFNADCILFDIDGVLVNINSSYNLAIKKTVNFVLKNITGKANLNGVVTDEIILRLRQSGGFNNDVDATYAIVLALLTKGGMDIQESRRFLSIVAKNADEGGIVSVESFLSSSESHSEVKKIKQLLAYPAPVGKSILATVFDELFYGPKLFKKRHRLKPKHFVGRPLINNERVVATQGTIDFLSDRYNGKLAVISGRSRLAARYSLGPIFSNFSNKASVFLEDEKRTYAKPNPYALNKAMKVLNARTAIYAGDSVEDLLMVKKVEEQGRFKIAFVGIYGCSRRPMEVIKMFEEKHVDTVLKTVNQLPKILNKV